MELRFEAAWPGPAGAAVVTLPTVTTTQMREVDRIMVEELGVRLLQMMENAGRAIAEVAVQRHRPSSCTVLAGSGGNGGGGLAAARHLHNRGVGVTVVTSSEPTAATAHQLTTLRQMDVEIADDPPDAELVVDAVIGYSLDGAPRGRAAELLRWADAAASPVLALDVPSGLDATTGQVHDPCVTAGGTVTLALPKQGLALAPEVVGELYVADIGVPPTVLATVGAPVAAPFAASPILRLRSG